MTATLQLEADVKAFFETSGFWISPPLLDRAELESFAWAQDRVHACDYDGAARPDYRSWSPGDDPAALRKIDNAHLVNKTLAGLVRNRVIGRLAAELLGATTIRLWHDQLLFKPPTVDPDGGIVGWHQDYHYWQCSDRPEMITAWVPFHDVDEKAGALQFVPGSHGWGHRDEFNRDGAFFGSDHDAQQRAIEAAMPPGAVFEPVTAAMSAGQVSFHHALTLHASGPNRSGRPRRSIALHLQSGACRWRSLPSADDHLCARAMKRRGRQPGEPFDGDPWPTLWP